MAGKTIPTVEELTSWYTPEQVRERAAQHVGEANAAESVWSRIRAGLIEAVGRSSSIQTGYGRPQPSHHPEPVPAALFGLQDRIPEKLWVGEVYFSLRGTQETDFKDTFVHVFGVRLDPADVDREFPPSVVGEPGAEDAAKPRIQDEWLRQWAALFNQLYPNAIEDFAVKSAKGMFHDKQVARDRIRPLLPARRPGPRKS